MQGTKSIIPINNSQLTIQTPENKESLFHDRAGVVARDILQQIGIDENKMRMIASMTSTLSMLPSIGPLAQVHNIIKDIEPFLLMVQNNLDPGAYIKDVPQEKIEYFINQVISRLEWVKYGNNDQEVHNQEQQNNA